MRIALTLAALSLATIVGGCSPTHTAAQLGASLAAAAIKSLAKPENIQALANDPTVQGVTANAIHVEPGNADQAASYMLVNEQQGLVLLKAMVDPTSARLTWPLWMATRHRQNHLAEKWTEYYQADPDHAKAVAATYNGPINAVLIKELLEMRRINSDPAIQQELIAVRTGG